MKLKEGCDCEKCRECCTREPGWFVPQEISIAATALGLSDKEYVATYCQEHEIDGVTALSPKQKPRSTACVFFEKGKCTIHNVKPYECRKVYGCEADRRHRRTRELVTRYWK
ncbi:MAG: YkgJ family cysteine cluster protein [Deltaproteobacteria bacterium]|nr:YkgJ family cysteine cluster protein [Deltaproteobacteria bacterium]